MSRRRTSAPSLVTILWRDIPAQLVATDGAMVEKAMLPHRFQIAIDRAARIAGKTETAAYVGQWRRATLPLSGDPAEAVAARLEEIDQSYSRDRLAALVRQGGLASVGEPT